MPDKELFGGKQRTSEEEFFYKRDRELAERLRSEAEAGVALRQFGEITGIADEALLRDLQRLGFSQQTAMLLDLAPLVLVAWSDGSITPQERNQIFQVARLRGVEEGAAAYAQLAGWLAVRPQEELFQAASRAIRAALEALPAEERESRRRALISHCTRVAAVSGGFLRLGSRISAAEQSTIRQIAEQLGCDDDCARETVQGVEEGEQP